MFTQKSIKIFHSVQEIRSFSLFQNLALSKATNKCHFAIVSLFSEFEPWQKLNQSQVSFDNLMGYILSISTCMKNFITIFHSVQEIAPLSLFQNLELGKASTNEKVTSQSLGLDLVKINVYAKVYHNIPLSSRDRAIFTFFRIWRSAKPRPMINVIFAIPWARSFQHQVVCKILSKYSKRFKS